MKLAYSSVASPSWDLATMVQKAKDYGFSGIELRGLQGQMHLPVAPELATNPARIGELMRDTGIDLVCLASSASFHMSDPKQAAENKAQVREFIDLAAALGCPRVRVHAGELPRTGILGYERRERVLDRITTSLGELATYAAARRVTIVVENGGDFTDSVAIWHIIDAASSPALRCCWNPFAARTRNERPTTSIPRLGSMIDLVHVCDGKFNTAGAFDGYTPPGQGSVEIPRLIQLLRGIGYWGYLVYDWPKLWVPSLQDADRALPAASAFLQPLLDEAPVVLTAYKGDKRPPRLPEIGAKA